MLTARPTVGDTVVIPRLGTRKFKVIFDSGAPHDNYVLEGVRGIYARHRLKKVIRIKE